jgi:hypothetical protein
MQVVQPEVEGEYCGRGRDGKGFLTVLDDALRKAPGANALVNASYMYRGFCLLIRGTAVHVE